MKDKYNKDEGFYIKAGWYAEEEQKQIEEMREHICIGCSGKPCGEYCDKCKFVAEELLKHYQPKLPKDSVVLSREELQEIIVKAKVKEREKISELKKEIKELYKLLIQEKEGSFWDGVNEGILKGSKETAEKIFNQIIWYAVKRIGQTSNDSYYQISFDRLNELAKQFGVEIKE